MMGKQEKRALQKDDGRARGQDYCEIQGRWGWRAWPRPSFFFGDVIQPALLPSKIILSRPLLEGPTAVLAAPPPSPGLLPPSGSPQTLPAPFILASVPEGDSVKCGCLVGKLRRDQSMIFSKTQNTETLGNVC